MHEKLDWRLAIDLLDVYLGDHPTSIGFGSHWGPVIARCCQIIENLRPGISVTLEEDDAGPWLSFITSDSPWSLLLTHPLAAGGGDLLDHLDKRQSQRPGDLVSHFNSYDMLRDPQGTLRAVQDECL